MGIDLISVLGANTLAQILQNVANSLGQWGNIIILILGIAMIIVGVYQLAKALITHGKGQPPNWFIIIALLLVGGLLIGSSLGGVVQLFNQGDANAILRDTVAADTDAISDRTEDPKWTGR